MHHAKDSGQMPACDNICAFNQGGAHSFPKKRGMRIRAVDRRHKVRSEAQGSIGGTRFDRRDKGRPEEHACIGAEALRIQW